MTTELILQLIGGAGALAGAAGVFQYTHDRTRIRAEVAREAASAYQAFVADVGRSWPTADTPRRPAPVTPAPGHAELCDTPGCSCRPLVPRAILELDTPWRGDGQTYDWCQGCNRTPNRRLMAYTEAGLYRCRDCRTVDGTLPEQPATGVAELLEAVAEAPGAALVPIVATVPVRWPTEPSLEGIFAEFDAFHTERPVECDGRRGNHGDPAIVCAMCCDTEDDEQAEADAREMLNGYGL
ncbi:hypothetical protein I5G63_gp078 [Mycobacterium phage Imvubu]|uniref:Uncharacterized protein n=1 Tax=Mycobacterium phage Imvubu TaxID=2686233 RepID=A0A6B9LK28_9CAUD|nr:hypothetical protein I5G63_gp078 [Mycobacterium phage Imvubu]QHB37819.1 hypothetical protein PBI_IMVUBU_78 [Mycobacterium phage Imvubu]